MKKLIILAVIGIPISACTTTKYVTSAKPFSGAVKQVCIDKGDQMTAGTASQIEANNLALSRIYKSRVACKQATAK